MSTILSSSTDCTNLLGLIRKGMIYSPQYGDTAFAVPTFDAFMRRSMPEWKAAGQRRIRQNDE